MEICITEECNLKCPYCYIKQERGVLTANTLEQALVNLLAHKEELGISAVSVSYFGGEPTLYPETLLASHETIKRHLTKISASYTLITNGWGLRDDELWSWIQKEGIGVSLSFDGLWQEDRAWVEEVIKKRGITSVKTMIYPEGLREASLRDNAGYLLSLGVSYVDMSLVRDPIWSDEDIELYREQLKQLACWYVSIFLDTGLKLSPFWLFIADSIYGKRDYACFAGHNGLALMPDGCWYPCARFGTNKEYCIIDKEGNLNKRRVEVFRYCNNPKHYVGCQGCKYYDFCNGGCIYSQIHWIDGLMPIESVCKLFRITFSWSHWVWDQLKDYPTFRELFRR